jgi:hypothetical protein
MPPEVLRAYKERRVTITENYYQDERGVFKSAFHPVTDKKGNVEFIIGVDYDVSYIASLNRKVLWNLFIALSATFPFIIVLIILLKKDTVAHVDKLTGDILVREKENLQQINYLLPIILNILRKSIIISIYNEAALSTALSTVLGILCALPQS